MIKIKLLFSILLLFLITSCSKDLEKKSLIKEKSLDAQVQEAYELGLNAFYEGDVLFAAKKFNEAETLFPQSVWAAKSALMAAYSYYSQDYYGDAISELKRFLNKFPRNNNTAYAYFLLATCYYELIVDEKKDLSSILKSKEYFEIVIKDFPNTDFALDANYKILLINNVLASKEMYIGRYYLEKQKWIPAMNRFKSIIDEHDETQYVEEALFRLVELNYMLGIETEAKKYASLLGYNYQSSIWYEKSYEIFNKNYENPINQIKKDSKNKILVKFKNLFE